METTQPLQLAVDPKAASTIRIRAAGELTSASGFRLLRLLDEVLGRAATVGDVHRVVVDLAGVRRFEFEGLAALRHARHTARTNRIDLALSGVDDHRSALPRRVEAVLAEFVTVEDVEPEPVGVPRRGRVH